MPDKLTPASLREWEDRLGPEKVQLAISILRSHGWGPESATPLWVYQQVYLMAEVRIPTEWGGKSQRLDERLLGFKLFS